MVVVKKTGLKKAKTKKSVIGRIMAVEDVPFGGVKVNIYGRGKTGKTRFACSFPKRLLLIGSEDGTKSVRKEKGVDFVQLESASEIGELSETCPGKYKSVVLDHASGLQDLVMKDVLGLDSIPLQKDWGTAERDDWAAIGSQTKAWMKLLLDLADSHGINVAIIAHERNFNDDSSGDGILMPTVGSALTPSVCGWLNGVCDYICQTYIRESVVERVSKVGKKRIVTKKRTGKKEYCLRTGPHEVFMTGFRRVQSQEELPECIIDPDYEKFMKLATG